MLMSPVKLKFGKKMLLKAAFVLVHFVAVYGKCTLPVTLPMITSKIKCTEINECELNKLYAEKCGDISTCNYPNQCGKEPYNWTTCFTSTPTCNDNYKYRTADGSCNNLQNTTWGMANSGFLRLLPAYYEDCQHKMMTAVDGSPRPLPRLLSNIFFKIKNPTDKVSLVTMEWGQLMAHDITLSTPASDITVYCCAEPYRSNDTTCMPIEVPPHDYFYGKRDLHCVGAIRTSTTLTGNCECGPTAQLDGVTSFLDLSTIYGSDKETADSLRTFKNGLLKVKEHNSHSYLTSFPNSEKNSNCFIKYYEEPCYYAGDVRTNQNTPLTCLITLFLRHHNRLAKLLQELNPEWNDETIYQEARRLNIAVYQQITYKEMLKLYVGTRSMFQNKLFPKKNGYTEYDPKINPMMINSFITVGFRSGHSGIPQTLNMYNYTRNKVNSVDFTEYMNKPAIIAENNNVDEFLLGLTIQPMMVFDRYFPFNIKNLLTQGYGPYGQDLVALDIQRGRDHGIAPYIHYLEICTGVQIRKFNDLKTYIPFKLVDELKLVYKTVEDVDLYVGALLENHVPGTRLGPVNLCLTNEQMVRTKFGDRFYFEHGNQEGSFTKRQLKEIRKMTLSRVICDCSNNITQITARAFHLESLRNPVVPCESIPAMDLSAW